MVKMFIRAASWCLKIDYRADVRLPLFAFGRVMHQNTIYYLNQVTVMGFQKVSCVKFHVSVGTGELPVFTSGHYLASYARPFKCTARDWYDAAPPMLALAE